MGLYPALPMPAPNFGISRFEIFISKLETRNSKLHLLSGKLFQALIKIYVRLVIYPIYSVVKYRPRQLTLT